MSSILAKKNIPFYLKSIIFYFSFISIAFGSYYKNIFNIQDQEKIKDLSFEIEINDMKKKIKPYFPLKNLDNFKIRVFWMKGGSFDIVLDSFPKGKKGIENNLKLQVLEAVKVLFPSDKLKELGKYYKIKKSGNRLVGVNESLRRRKVVIGLNENGLIEEIESYFPLNRLIESYGYKKWNEKFLMVSKIEKSSIYKDNYVKNTSYQYSKINGFTLPEKIEVIEEVKTRINLKIKKEKINKFKNYIIFKNYKINKGNANNHFGRLIKDKK